MCRLIRSTEDRIFDEYKKLLRTPSGNAHAKQYYLLCDLCRNNQDALYALIFSGKVTDERQLEHLICFGGHGGSVAKRDNLHWIPFLKRVNERIHELPQSIQVSFSWLGKVHGYWDDESEGR